MEYSVYFRFTLIPRGCTTFYTQNLDIDLLSLRKKFLYGVKAADGIIMPCLEC
jgi:hypothetical protein